MNWRKLSCCIFHMQDGNDRHSSHECATHISSGGETLLDLPPRPHEDHISREFLPTNDRVQQRDVSNGRLWLPDSSVACHCTAVWGFSNPSLLPVTGVRTSLPFPLLSGPFSFTGFPLRKSRAHLIPLWHLLQSRHEPTHDANDNRNYRSGYISLC